MPERLPVQRGKGKGDAAGLAQGNNPPPVEVEQLVEFDQIPGDIDERRGNTAPGRQIEDGQQQDGLVGSAFSDSLGPDWGGAMKILRKTAS
jgi:hypothetical protein